MVQLWNVPSHIKLAHCLLHHLLGICGSLWPCIDIFISCHLQKLLTIFGLTEHGKAKEDNNSTIESTKNLFARHHMVLEDAAMHFRTGDAKVQKDVQK